MITHDYGHLDLNTESTRWKGRKRPTWKFGEHRLCIQRLELKRRPHLKRLTPAPNKSVCAEIHAFPWLQVASCLRQYCDQRTPIRPSTTLPSLSAPSHQPRLTTPPSWDTSPTYMQVLVSSFSTTSSMENLIPAVTYLLSAVENMQKRQNISWSDKICPQAGCRKAAISTVRTSISSITGLPQAKQRPSR